MSQSNEEIYRKRIADLEAENTRLRDSLAYVKAERKELREQIYGPVKIENETTEEELIEIMKNHQPGSAGRLLNELGLSPRKPT